MNDIKTCRLLFLILIVINFSCQNIKNEAEPEQESNDVIVKQYGGTVAYQIEGEINQASTTNSYVVTLNQSSVAEKLKKIPDIFSAGVAYQFYSHLRTPEHCKQISVDVIYQSGEKINNTFSAEELKSTGAQMHHLDEVYRLLKTHQIDSLKEDVYPQYYSKAYNKDTIFRYVKMFSDTLTDLNTLKFLGFKNYESGGQEFLKLSGAILQGRYTIPLSVYINKRYNQIAYLSFIY